MYRNRTISIIIPCHNEEKAIVSVIKEIPSYINQIIVVDNNSEDNTVELARSCGAEIVIENRRGYGHAWRKGLENAHGEVIVTIDGDGTYAYSEIKRMMDLLIDQDLDFVSGDRLSFLNRSNMKFLNYAGNIMLSSLVRFLFSCNIKDSQSGMWVAKRDLLKKFNLTSAGMSLSEEVKIESFGKIVIKAKEIPIRYKARIGDSKLNIWLDGFKNILFLFKKRFLSGRGKISLDGRTEKDAIKQANKDFFDTVADSYDEINGFVHKSAKANIAKNIDFVIGSGGSRTLLDLCCGTGFFTSCVREKFGFSCGIDISLNMLKKYQRLARGICADVYSLPFKDRVFDVVVCSCALHHIYDFDPVLKEAHRALKKDGFLYLAGEIDKQFVGRFYFFVKLYRMFFGVHKKYLKDPRVKFREFELAEYHNTFERGIDPADLKKRLFKIGFSEIDIKYHYRPKILSPFFSILAIKR